ncbi:MAG: acyl-CoA dehydrogenase family protein [Hyphomicrobiaceae bacterium]|nr:acyl-CoA dehydrogenase family protein [Hyphomicrobiaceae bacterium]
MPQFTFEPVTMPPEARRLRAEVRAFLDEEIATGGFSPTVGAMVEADPAFSRKVGERGWLGMTWPREYGGGERSSLERFVVIEELLAAGAPVMAHWIGERQSGPQILRHGSERAKRTILPEIAAGRCYFAIGMSEPDTGSDLASVKTRAVKAEGGWRITGRKVWTSYAHRAHYLIALVRTSGSPEQRHHGLTQFIVDVKSPGISVRPIYNLYGGHDFNEVTFDDVFVPEDMTVGGEGRGWDMVVSELAFERSGPDRFMSTYPLLVEAVSELGPDPEPMAAAEVGRLVANLATLRRMSVSIAGMLNEGKSPVTEAALVKDLGTTFEQEIPEVVRRVLPIEPRGMVGANGYADLQQLSQMQCVSYSIRGGTREILRGMIARGLGLR